MKSIHIKVNRDGTSTRTETEVPEESLVGDPLYEAAKALAEANPGRVVCGVRAEDPTKDPHQVVDLLDNL